MILSNMKVIDGNSFIACLEDTEYFEDWCEPAPDGYTKTITKKDVDELAEKTDCIELSNLSIAMMENMEYVLFFD